MSMRPTYTHNTNREGTNLRTHNKHVVAPTYAHKTKQAGAPTYVHIHKKIDTGWGTRVTARDRRPPQRPPPPNNYSTSQNLHIYISISYIQLGAPPRREAARDRRPPQRRSRQIILSTCCTYRHRYRWGHLGAGRPLGNGTLRSARRRLQPHGREEDGRV